MSIKQALALMLASIVVFTSLPENCLQAYAETLTDGTLQSDESEVEEADTESSSESLTEDDVNISEESDTDTDVSPDVISVTFDANGGAFTNGEVTKEVAFEPGAEVSSNEIPEAPYLEGYRFLGWFYDRDCKSAIEFSTMIIDSSVTIYAGYSENIGADNEDDLLVGQSGDIASGSYENTQWRIDSEGTFYVSGIGDAPRIQWYHYTEKILKAEISLSECTTLEGFFSGCVNLKSIDLSRLDTSNVTDMSQMFLDCYELETLDLSGFNTENVEDMSSMFSGCSSIEALDLSGFNTENVEDMSSMFRDCSSIETLDLSGFNTENVENMGGMFRGMSSLYELKIDNFDTGNVRYMYGMFGGCSSLTELNLKTFNTINVVNMEQMFLGCCNIETLDLSSFNTENVEDMSYMFNLSNSVNLKTKLRSIDVSGWDTSNVEDMENMFSGCDALVDLDVSKWNVSNVRRMWGMFSRCMALPQLDVSKWNTSSVTDMGFMFNNCSSVEELDVSKWNTSNVTDMSYMFSYCSSVEELDVSNWNTSSVTNINGTFCFCEKLEKINVSEWDVSGVNEINSTFVFCRKLKELNLSLWDMSNVNSTSDMCGGSDSLSKIYVDASLMVISRRSFPVFDNKPSVLKDVYYTGSEEQWNQIDMGTDNEKLDSAIIHYNYVCAHSRKPKGNRTKVKHVVPKGKYGICVVDRNDKPLSLAKVTIGNQSMITDETGYVEFDLIPILFSYATTGELKVEKTGFFTWSNKGGKWTPSENCYEEIRLYEESLGGCYISWAYYMNSEGMSVDLLHRVKKIGLCYENEVPLFPHIDIKEFQIMCTAFDPSAVEKYYLMQGDTCLAESDDGWFEIDLDEVQAKKGGDVYIATSPKAGPGRERFRTDINLEFFETKAVEETSMDLDIGEISFKVNDSIPYFGGSRLKFKIPTDFPIYANSTESGKIAIGYNMKLDNKDAIDEFKSKTIQNINKIKATDFDKLVAKKEKCSLLSNSFDINLCGYFEADPESDIASGNLFFIIKYKPIKAEYNTFVSFVPVTVQFDLDTEFKGKGVVEYKRKENKLDGHLTAKMKAKLEAFGGIGLGRCAGVGAYGSAEGIAEFILSSTFAGFKTVDLIGDLGLKAYVGIFQYKRSFAYRKWNLYNNAYLQASGDVELLGDELIQEICADDFERVDFSYLRNESEWLGSAESDIILLSSANINAMSISPLYEGTYQNAQPCIVAAEDGIYLAFLRADAETEEVYVAISKYDGNSWSVPVRLETESVLDDAPKMCVDNDGNIWIVYTRAKEGTTSNTMQDYALGRELVISKIDTSSLKATDTKVFTGNGYINRHDIVNLNGRTVITWLDSTVNSNDDTLDPQESIICYVEIDGTIPDEYMELGSVQGSIGQVIPGAYAQENGVAYTLLQSASDDQVAVGELFFVNYSGESTKLADIGTGSVCYGVMPGKTDGEFLWNGQVTESIDEEEVLVDALIGISGSFIRADGLTDYYSVAGDSIYYSTGALVDSEGEFATYLKQVECENGTYSNDVLQLANSKYFEDLCAVTYNGTDYIVGMNTTATITGDDLDISKDLVWGYTEDISDVQVMDCSYDPNGEHEGENVPVSIRISNNSSHDINSICIDINGEITTETVDLPIGGEKDITVDLVFPTEESEYEISISEKDHENASDKNCVSIVLASPDVKVESQMMRSGDQKGVEAIVRNIGGSKASGIVNLYDVDGELYDSMEYSELLLGDSFIASFWVDNKDADRFKGDIRVETVMVGEENYTGNNSETISLLWDEEPSGGGDNPDPDPEKEKYNIKAYAGTGGTISPVGVKECVEGSDQTYSIVPTSGYEIRDVLVDGESVGSISEYTFTDIRTTHTIRAIFYRIEKEEDLNEIKPGDLADGEEIPQGLWVVLAENPDSADGEYYYTGKAIKPEIRVYDGKKLLVSGKDYTVKYSNNTKAYILNEGDEGFYNSKGKTTAPAITVTGKGNYRSKETVYFRINKIDISETNSAVFCDDLSVGYNKKPQKPVPALSHNGKALKNKTDFVVTYYDKSEYTDINNPGTELTSVINSGEYIARLTGKGNYSGFRDVKLSVVADTKATVLVTKLSYSKIPSQPYNDGEPLTPAVTVKAGNTTLISNVDSATDYDYSISYENNTNVGTGYVVITGNPDRGYSGTRRISFKITGTSIKNSKITGLPSAFEYTGAEITLEEMIENGVIRVTAKGTGEPLTMYDPITGEGDYKLSYKNNTKVGKATVTITGTNGFTGSVNKTYKIIPYSLNGEKISITIPSYSPYEKGGSRAPITVMFEGKEKPLSVGSDYTVTYKNGKKAGDTVTVTVKGKGNYKDTYNKSALTYQVSWADIGKLSIASSDKTYQNKKNAYTTKITITDENGKQLKAGTDYWNLFSYKYGTDVYVTRVYSKTEMMEKRSAGDMVYATDIIPAGTLIEVTITGINNYYGTITDTYRITEKSIASAKVTIPAHQYTGKRITLSEDDITVKIGGKALAAIDPVTGKKNWMIDKGSYSNNINKGKASVTIKGLGNYGGIKTQKFSITAKRFWWWWRN